MRENRLLSNTREQVIEQNRLLRNNLFEAHDGGLELAALVLGLLLEPPRLLRHLLVGFGVRVGVGV